MLRVTFFDFKDIDSLIYYIQGVWNLVISERASLRKRRLIIRSTKFRLGLA